jgi:hypothetical protein
MTGAVTCPYCGAQPQARCVGYLGGDPVLVPVPFHYARVKAALKARQSGAAR